jgi:3-oxoacyl-[acyl-carrier protein] reductase
LRTKALHVRQSFHAKEKGVKKRRHLGDTVWVQLSDFFGTSDEDWERMFNINVWSGVRLTRTYMRSMLQRGRGRVIFISIEVALTPMAAMAHYSASKATQLSISRSLTELTKGTAVTVNCVLPRPTETENTLRRLSNR